MASINELINLSQYISGDVGREGLNGPRTRSKTPQEQKVDFLKVQALAAEVARREQEAALAKRQRDLWDSVGKVQGRNKTESGVTTAVVDDEEAGGRDIVTVGDYESPGYGLENSDGSANRYEGKISASGRMTLALPKKEKSYDRIKVIDRAKKLIDVDLLTEGINKKTMKASDYSVRLKKAIPQAETDLYGKAITPTQQVEQENIVPEKEAGLQFAPDAKPDAIVPQAVGPLDPRRMSKNFAYFGETAKEKAGKKPDTYGFHVGQIVSSAKGRVKYIGNNKWQKVK